MDEIVKLRARLMAALASGSALAALATPGCGGDTSADDQGGMPSHYSCGKSEGVKQCRLPPTPDGGGAATLNDCPSPSSVQDSCCNAADFGPWMEDGQCCYLNCPSGVCCGRPLLIDGRERLAPVVNRAEWLAALGEPGPLGLDDASRAALAEAWLLDARLEHASIASFARWSLELLALGAPAELLADAQSAAVEEVTHAKLCFALASVFLGRSVGPGPLDVRGAMTHAPTLPEVAAATVREGCIGETLSALLAQEQLAVATDPGARHVLEHIFADEARHAALAWRFVAWALGCGGHEVRRAVEKSFAEVVLPSLADPPKGTAASTWNAYGRLTAAQSERHLRRAVREVLEPCASALLRNSKLAIAVSTASAALV